LFSIAILSDDGIQIMHAGRMRPVGGCGKTKTPGVVRPDNVACEKVGSSVDPRQKDARNGHAATVWENEKNRLLRVPFGPGFTRVAPGAAFTVLTGWSLTRVSTHSGDDPDAPRRQRRAGELWPGALGPASRLRRRYADMG
jgi:hypothetical protein